MRRAHSIFVTADGKCELLFDYRTHHLEQKKRIKELVHEGYSVGGTVEFLTSDGDRFLYKVPPLVAPVAKQPAQKKKVLA